MREIGGHGQANQETVAPAAVSPAAASGRETSACSKAAGAARCREAQWPAISAGCFFGKVGSGAIICKVTCAGAAVGQISGISCVTRKIARICVTQKISKTSRDLVISEACGSLDASCKIATGCRW